MKTNGLPPDYKEREGDVLILHATVCYPWSPERNDEFLVEVKGRVASILIKRSDVVGIASMKFEVGEKVRQTDCGSIGEIVAIHNDWAWINFGAPDARGGGALLKLSDLVRLEEEPNRVAAA